MSILKINENQFLGKQELNKWNEFLTTSGYKLLFKQVVGRFGVIKSPLDLPFDNLRVIEGSTLGYVTIKKGYAIDGNMNLITVPDPGAINAIDIPPDSAPRNIFISYNKKDTEKGTVEIAIDGTLTGTGTEFLSVLRGTPNHPVKIKFPNSLVNTQEYEVSIVINNGSAAILGASFTYEPSQEYTIIGTFTPGVFVPTLSKRIYQYDHYRLELTAASTGSYGYNYKLASVTFDGVTLQITDLRDENLFSMSDPISDDILNTNSILGLESIKYDNIRSAQDRNLARIGWGIRSTSGQWVATPVNNKVTINTGEGGIYVDLTTLPTGTLNGWRLYFSNGNYAKVVSSTLVGPNYEIVIADYNLNLYPTTGEITIVPDADEIQIDIVNEPETALNLKEQNYFSIQKGYADLRLLNLFPIKPKIRFKRGSIFSDIILLNDSTYLNETSFDTSGNPTSPVTSNVVSGIFTCIINTANEFYTNKMWKNKTNIVSGVNSFQNATAFIGSQERIGDVIDSPFQSSASGFVASSTEFENKNYIRYATTGLQIGGFANVANGKIINIYNSTISTGEIELVHESGGTTAVERLKLPNDESINIEPGQRVSLIYDQFSNRWLLKTASFVSNQVWKQFDPTLLTVNSTDLNLVSKVGYWKRLGKTLFITMKVIYDGPVGAYLTSMLLDLPNGYQALLTTPVQNALIASQGDTPSVGPYGSGVIYRPAYAVLMTPNTIRINNAFEPAGTTFFISVSTGLVEVYGNWTIPIA